MLTLGHFLFLDPEASIIFRVARQLNIKNEAGSIGCLFISWLSVSRLFIWVHQHIRFSQSVPLCGDSYLSVSMPTFLLHAWAGNSHANEAHMYWERSQQVSIFKCHYFRVTIPHHTHSEHIVRFGWHRVAQACFLLFSLRKRGMTHRHTSRLTFPELQQPAWMNSNRTVSLLSSLSLGFKEKGCFCWFTPKASSAKTLTRILTLLVSIQSCAFILSQLRN